MAEAAAARTDVSRSRIRRRCCPTPAAAAAAPVGSGSRAWPPAAVCPPALRRPALWAHALGGAAPRLGARRRGRAALRAGAGEQHGTPRGCALGGGGGGARAGVEPAEGQSRRGPAECGPLRRPPATRQADRSSGLTLTVTLTLALTLTLTLTLT